MGKTDHDQHQIDKNRYCSVTFSKIMNGNTRLISTVLQNPCHTCHIQGLYVRIFHKFVCTVGLGLRDMDTGQYIHVLDTS